MAITRQRVLVEYVTDLETGTMFAKYDKRIVDDADGSFTSEGTHRETITKEAYDEIKLNAFVNQLLVDKADALNRLAQEKAVIQADLDTVLEANTALEAENAELKK